MRQSLKDGFEKNIDELKCFLAQHDTYAALGYFSNFLTLHMQETFEKTGLSSPCKEFFYLGGLLLSTEQKDTKQFGQEEFEIVRDLLEEITKFYALMFFPAQEEIASGISEKWVKATEVSMPVFLNYFNTAILCQSEQLFERIQSWFVPFDAEIKQEYGVSVSEIVTIHQFLLNALQQQFNTIQATQQKFQDKQRDFLNTYDEQKYTLEQMQSFADQHPVKDAAVVWYDNLINVYKYPVKELKKSFDEQAVEGFLQLFSLERSEQNFRYYTEDNPFETSPIWKISDEQIFIGFLPTTHYSLYNTIIALVEKSTFKKRFYRNRDDESEKKALSIFQNLFGENAEYYPSLYENDKSENEHDLVVQYKNHLLIVEIKASKVKAPFRDPEKAFLRIQRDFKSDKGIQKAYNQGLHLKQLICSQVTTPLFDKKGNHIVTLQKKDISQIYILCITAEQLGTLAANLSLLLEKPNDEPYPWSCNLFDLENFVEGLQYANFPPEAFLEYLEERAILHEKLHSSDELEIAGCYLLYGFDAIKEQYSKADRITFGRTMQPFKGDASRV